MMGPRRWLRLRRRARFIAEVRANADCVFFAKLAADTRAARREKFLSAFDDVPWQRVEAANIYDYLVFYQRYSGGPR